MWWPEDKSGGKEKNKSRGGGVGFIVLFWMSPSQLCCKECACNAPETLNALHRHDVSSSTPAASPPSALLVPHTHTQARHTLQCKRFLPVAGLASFRSKIRAEERVVWKRGANRAVFLCLSDRSDHISVFGRLMKKSNCSLPYIHCRCGTLTVCFASNVLQSPPPSLSGRFSQTTGQFSSPHFLIESRSRASEHEFPVTPPCLWSISVLTSLFHCRVVLHGKRRASSHPRGSSLVDLRWQSVAVHQNWIRLDTSDLCSYC